MTRYQWSVTTASKRNVGQMSSSDVVPPPHRFGFCLKLTGEFRRMIISERSPPPVPF